MLLLACKYARIYASIYASGIQALIQRKNMKNILLQNKVKQLCQPTIYFTSIIFKKRLC
jgi:hypothetical protein